MAPVGGAVDGDASDKAASSLSAFVIASILLSVSRSNA